MLLHRTFIALFAATLFTGAALAQTSNNSGTMVPDVTDAARQRQQLQIPQSSNVLPPATTGQGVPRATPGQGATNTDSGTMTPDEQDSNAKRLPGDATNNPPAAR